MSIDTIHDEPLDAAVKRLIGEGWSGAQAMAIAQGTEPRYGLEVESYGGGYMHIEAVFERVRAGVAMSTSLDHDMLFVEVECESHDEARAMADSWSAVDPVEVFAAHGVAVGLSGLDGAG